MKKTTVISLFVVVLAMFLVNGQVQAWTIPTISILGVTQNEKVTIQTYNYPANYDFEVRMGLFGTKGVDGVLVGTVNSGDGGSMKFTFPIPTELQSESMIAIRLQSTVGGYYSYDWFYNTDYGSHDSGVLIGDITASASISATSVKEGEYVVIKAANLPASEDFKVLMDEYGNEGLDGVVVDTVNSGTDGNFTETFDIPVSLMDENKIAVRFESQDSSLVLTTWFENVTGASGGLGGGYGVYYGIPTISITSVNEDDDVTIQTNNFPANKDFQVYMGKIGTRGVGGILVTTINSGDGGSFPETFDIPTPLKGDYQIAIRLQTADNYFYAYNWFYNNTTTGTPTGTTTSGYMGIPTFSITAVVADDKVTIQTNNFPANYDFEVLMGKMWTQGIGGIPVTTINSGSGGTFTKSFNIPAALAGEKQISIRLQSTVGGFYAYNWFYNNTYP
jgi:hypothetical protein